MKGAMHYGSGLSWRDGRWTYHRRAGAPCCWNGLRETEARMTNNRELVTCKACKHNLAIASMGDADELIDPEPELVAEWDSMLP